MNKKFLSAILFGALMVTATGTFVSCKDYDDDIDRIDKELTDIKSQIAALQTAVDNGKWITSVEQTANGLTITMNDGKTYPVTNGKDGAQGEKGEAGDKVLIDATTGAITINGEATGFFATKNTETGKFAVPEIGEDGFWYVVNKEGKLEATSYKASPVSAVQDPNTKAWTLKVWNTETKAYDEIKLPTAASSLTDLIIIDGHQDLTYAVYEFNNQSIKIADWKGPRTLPAEKGKSVQIVSSITSPVMQINPTTIDGEEITFSLVDSKNNYPKNVNLTAKAYDELITVARAASTNGLYSLSLEEVFIAPNKLAEFEAQFAKDNAKKGYAVTAGGTVRSEYQLAVSKANGVALTQLSITGDAVVKVSGNEKFNIDATYGTDAATVAGKINVNEWYEVSGIEAAALYDMHLSVDNDAKTLFGIEIEEKAGEYKFRATKTPDNITKAGFELVINAFDKAGKLSTTNVWLGETSVITNEVVYDPISYQLKNAVAGKNYFSIDLAKMRTALGTNGEALWNTKSVLNNAVVEFYDADDELMANANGIAAIFVKKVVDAHKDVQTAVAKEAKNVMFEIDNAVAGNNFEVGKQYTAVITFNDADREELNVIKIPFTLTLPAITTLFEIDPGFINNNIANCYLYSDDFKAVNTTDGAATFKLNRIFKKYETTGFTLALDDKTAVTDNKKSSDLATVGTANASSVGVTDATYVTLSGDLGKEKGYDQPLNFTISGKFANAWEYPEDAIFTFKAKVMSPIEKGKIVPKTGNVVTIKASSLDGYKFGNDAITGYTYNTEVSYKVLPDKFIEGTTVAWTRNDIAAVTAETGNKLYFEVDNDGKPSAATQTTGNTKTTVDGSFTLKGYQVDHTVDTTIKIKVTDIWNRAKSNDVPVKITVGE